MRKLTVKRRKKFFGCAGKVKIYSYDANGNTYINGVPCKLLGKLKNGESATYEIGNESIKLFVYEERGKSFCNDYYNVPAGEEDFEVSGAVHFGWGNPFLFDGVTDWQALANRAKNRRSEKLLLVGLFIGALIFGICGIAVL